MLILVNITLGSILLGILTLPKELVNSARRYKRLSKDLLTCLLEWVGTSLLVSSVVMYFMAIFNIQLQIKGFSVLLCLTRLRFLISLMQVSSCQETLSHSGV